MFILASGCYGQCPFGDFLSGKNELTMTINLPHETKMILHRVKRQGGGGIIPFRPLFVYRQQQKEMQEKWKEIEERKRLQKEHLLQYQQYQQYYEATKPSIPTIPLPIKPQQSYQSLPTAQYNPNYNPTTHDNSNYYPATATYSKPSHYPSYHYISNYYYPTTDYNSYSSYSYPSNYYSDTSSDYYLSDYYDGYES